MSKLRQEFWTDSKELIKWCTDDELRVLNQRAAKELESRLVKLTKNFDTNEANRKKAGQNKARRNARGLTSKHRHTITGAA